MQLIQQRTEQDPWFGEICKQFSRNPFVNGLPLTSYLLKPMQRITKYPLLVDKILKNTSNDHPDHAQLTEASRRMAQLCSQINEAVQMVENTERLEWCQSHLLPSTSSSPCLSNYSPTTSTANQQGLAPRIVFNSFTNTLGPRKLLYHGPLVKAKSGKELIGFLFNDFLLLTQPLNKEVAKKSNIFTDDRALRSQYRFYKEPFFIEKLKLDESTPEGPNAEGLIVVHTEIMDNFGLPTKYELCVRAGGSRERTGWLTKIRQAIANYEANDRKNRFSSLSQLELTQSGCGRLLVVVQCAKQLTRVTAESQDTFCSLSLGGQTHVTSVVPSSANPSWNATMQFVVKDLKQEVLCITVLQRQKFSPNEFLGRTEIRVSEIHERRQHSLGAINFSDLRLLEVPSGTVSLRVDLQLFREAPQLI
ncbi:intersectin-2-like [Tropilaelaps mercedesae]|uniref:Intersectin-2-like n=1 Tax=Tropilaelaps mercedesae TaxID=418985 RepID=A0A1V9XSR2_9ACAR|nr:intersectin-2-like [Tropilaelaps mercedesae]